MKLLKLPWLQHREEHKSYEVYTCDVSPDSQRLATGGLDGKIRIWSIPDILKFASNPNASADKDILMKPLSTMSRHAGSVTTVKFSPDGKYLASGSDDRILLIWELEGGTTQPMFGAESTDIEHWNVRRRLVAHDNDIQDICWAPDSSIMVSVGLDRAIIIWNGSTFEKVKRFDVHQSHVKGVVFDPANKYFATASDDRTIKMFRYHKTGETSFSVEHVITEPFKGSPLTTYFRRLSWSPDGQHIAAPNAMNGPVSTVAIIERGTWESPVSLVGHDQPTEVASFNPRIFKRQKDDSTTDTIDGQKTGISDEVDCIVASSGQDKTLAVWSTSKARPLIVAQDICGKSITDMSWTPDGKILFITSLDSSIVVLAFEDNEFGEAIPLEQNIEYLHRYGVDKDSLVFPETVEQLILEDQAKNLKKSNVDMNLLENRLGKPGTIAEPNILQVRSKKRAQLTSTGNHTDNNTTSKAEPPHVNILQVKRKNKVTGVTEVLHDTVVKNGKKRVAPTLITMGHSPDKSRKRVVLSTAQSLNNSVQPTTKPVPEEKSTLAKLQSTKLSKPSFSIPRLGIHTLIMGFKERTRENFMNQGPTDSTVDENNVNIDEVPQQLEQNSAEEHLLTLNSKTTLEKIWRDEPNTRYLEFNSILPDADAVLREMGTIDDLYVLEVRNGVERSIQFDTEALYDNSTRVLGYHAGQRSFELFFPDVVLTCVGCIETKTWILATTTGQLFFIDTLGQARCPRISIGHKIIKLCTSRSHVIAITETALIYVWDLVSMSLTHKNIPLLPLLARDPITGNRARFTSKIKSAKMTENKDLQLVMTDVAADSESNPSTLHFLYSSSLSCWCSLKETLPVDASVEQVITS
ncbi:Hir1 [Kluyveromyces lactis]|nr:Hir1 [Kluyveromyces lactis]